MTTDEFTDAVLAMEGVNDDFEPHAYYDADGDCVEFMARPDDFYAERIDDLVTVYYSRETNEIVGSFIKGISQFCDRMKARLPGFVIQIETKPIRIEHLFLARMWADGDEIQVMKYQQLVKVAEESGVETEICPA